VNKPREYEGLVINTIPRNFVFKFQTQAELIQWYHKMQSVASKEIKLKRYIKRVKE